MSKLYGEKHRALQNQFDSKMLADRLEQMIVKTTLDAADQGFISARDMFFLSSIDHLGRPTVSYKGGDPGFITIVDGQTIAFPSYDGNGMFLSMGNIQGNPQVGLLFIDFARPNRLRLQGTATITPDDPLHAKYQEADLIVRVAVQQLWVNCPRYIHQHNNSTPATHVPRPDQQTPLADWKRIDVMQEVLPAKDQTQVRKQGGSITAEEYGRRLQDNGSSKG